VNTGSHRPKSQAAKPKSNYLPFVLKTKSADGKKWNVHAYVSLKADLSGGVATIVLPDGTKLEKVNVFPNDKKKEAGAGEAKDSVA